MIRRTNVITKLRLTYVKDAYLDVSHTHIPRPPADSRDARSKSTIEPVRTRGPRSWRADRPMLTGDDWSDCFRVDAIRLPSSPFLGVSALTGQVFDAHEYVFHPRSERRLTRSL